MAPRAGPHRAEGVRSRAGLSHSERADKFSGAQPRQEAPALLLAAVAVEVVHHEVVGVEPGEGEGRIPVSHDLADERRGKIVEALAAIVMRDGGTQVAHSRDLAKRLRRPPFLVVHPLLERMKRGFEILARVIAQFDLFGGQCELTAEPEFLETYRHGHLSFLGPTR